ncbi:SdpA family antimicrobial peptide system protein (plasmid) [Flammeovirga pectinis]|uniref:SdpA family antimicrobial peptide system protein n=1 Tax=Flammeovirga pectinis TaxID=2494373 RepID=A0A3Q9FTJ5_9BACT|nr:SdpA family antimicrobial peptide system protein [Flammeovirga pectinis]AZQ65653.1 SdpA family antimicrobial peptide system protein [Flammeovirga pectinis]
MRLSGIDAQKINIRFILILLLFVYFVLLIFFVSIPDNTIISDSIFKKNIASISPQGWGFFTKSPREELIYLYNSNFERIDFNNSSPKNFFGIKRYSRALSREVSILASNVNDSVWTEGKGIQIFIKEERIIDIKDDRIKHIKKGEYYLVKYNLPPWALSKVTSKDMIPYKICHIKM